MWIKRLIAVLSLLTFGAGLAACGSGGSQHHASSPPGAPGASPDAQIAAFVQCYRTHGDASFPDPVYDPGDGRWHFATSPGMAPASTRQACQHLLPPGTASPPLPQAQLEQLLRLARCIRQHGVPSWPDPDAEGAFPLPPPLQHKTPAIGDALKACQQDIPSGGLDVIAAS